MESYQNTVRQGFSYDRETPGSRRIVDSNKVLRASIISRFILSASTALSNPLSSYLTVREEAFSAISCFSLDGRSFWR